MNQSSDMRGHRFGGLAFLRSVKVELAQVKWPNRAETRRLTTLVIVVSILVGIYVGGLDLLLTSIVTNLIK